MKRIILLTLLLTGLTGCMSRWRPPSPVVENNQPNIPFAAIDTDNNGTITPEEYAAQGFGSYVTEEPIITMVVIVLCVVLLTGGLAWIYRSNTDFSSTYDEKE